MRHSAQWILIHLIWKMFLLGAVVAAGAKVEPLEDGAPRSDLTVGETGILPAGLPGHVVGGLGAGGAGVGAGGGKKGGGLGGHFKGLKKKGFEADYGFSEGRTGGGSAAYKKGISAKKAKFKKAKFGTKAGVKTGKAATGGNQGGLVRRIFGEHGNFGFSQGQNYGVQYKYNNGYSAGTGLAGSQGYGGGAAGYGGGNGAAGAVGGHTGAGYGGHGATGYGSGYTGAGGGAGHGAGYTGLGTGVGHGGNVVGLGLRGLGVFGRGIPGLEYIPG